MKSVPVSVWRLMVAYSLMMAGTSMMVLIAGIIGVRFAPGEGWATLPIAFVVIGVAASTLPTGRCFARWGRRRVFVAYGLLALSSALLGAYSLASWSFPLFCLSALMMGWSGAATHQYRFAALEHVPSRLAPKATSVLLLGGILGAFIGPELAVAGRDLLETPFSGSFLLLAVSYALGAALVSLTPDSEVEEELHEAADRTLAGIFRSPVVILAVSSAALAYGVMSFLMTATPISMHEHAGHGLVDTKRVIQAHIVAMYLPSLVFAWLLAKLGFRKILAAGFAALAITLLVAIADTALLNYWLAMVILGVGWNLLFLGGTNLLVYGYRSSERYRVQAANDFLVFTVQATVSLSSGWALYRIGWTGLILSVVPVMFAFAILLWRSRAFSLITVNMPALRAERRLASDLSVD